MNNNLEFQPLLRGSDAFSLKTRRHRFPLYQLVLFIHDLTAVILAFAVGAWIVGLDSSLSGDLNQMLILTILSVVGIAFFRRHNVYSYHRIFSSKIHLANILKSFGWSLLSLVCVVLMYHFSELFQGQALIVNGFLVGVGLMLLSRYFSDHLLNISSTIGISFVCIGLIRMTLEEGERAILLEGWYNVFFCFTLSAGLILISRYALVQFVFKGLMRERFRRQVVIIGSDEEAKRITNYVIEHNAPFWVSGFVGAEGGGNLEFNVCKDHLCELKDLPAVVDKIGISEILVTDENIDKRTLISLLDYCTSEGLIVWFLPKLMPIIDMKLYIDDFCSIPMIRLCSQSHGWISNKMKHTVDIIITLPVVVMLLPVFFAIATAIKLNSRGQVFYCAKAVGRDGKEFTMYKFRSMLVNNGNEIHKDFVTKLIKGEIRKEQQKGGVLKITDDQRVTSVGRILRKYSLDELPQLINVLKGDMGLVGPRPCLPYEYEIYKDWHKKRLSIRPGITCLWQVVGRSDVLFEDMVLLDLYYIYSRGFSMDLRILYETAFAVLGKRGAY